MEIRLNWVFFILASFILLVVFMNMIIAIMGETFSQVQSTKEESSLLEQLQLIRDHDYLIKPEEEFKGMRYIIRASLCMDS